MTVQYKKIFELHLCLFYGAKFARMKMPFKET